MESHAGSDISAAERFVQESALWLTEAELARQCRRCGSLTIPLREDTLTCDDLYICDWNVAKINEHAAMVNPRACVMCGLRDMALNADGACFMRKCADDYAKFAARLLRLRKFYREATRDCAVESCPRGPYDDPKRVLERAQPCWGKSDCPVGK